MIILGIDPGSRRIGYGVLACGTGNEATYVEAGMFRVTADNDADALTETQQEIERLIAQFKPEVVALEKLYFARNRTTAMQVAEARGVIVMTTLAHRLTLKEYTPNEVKLATTGHGGADKKAIAKMVRLILRTPTLDLIDDAMDALAIALTAAQNAAFDKAKKPLSQRP